MNADKIFLNFPMIYFWLYIKINIHKDKMSPRKDHEKMSEYFWIQTVYLFISLTSYCFEKGVQSEPSFFATCAEDFSKELKVFHQMDVHEFQIIHSLGLQPQILQN